MSSGLKQLIPLAIRDRFRPLYRAFAKEASRIAEQWKPTPPAWKELKQRLAGGLTSPELYAVSQAEFGVLQKEAEIVGVLDYIAQARPQVIGEIGLKHGGNSFLFTNTCRAATHFLGLDLVLQNVGKLQFLAPPGMQLTFFEGSSYAPQTVQRVSEYLRGRKFDFLFIDGDHSFDGVKEDFLQYCTMVRPGGLIGFHDIVPDEVARFGIKPEASQCYGGDVYAFWKLLKPHFAHKEFVASWDQIGFGIGVITLPAEPLSREQLESLKTQLVQQK